MNQKFLKELTTQINLSLQQRNKGAIRNRHTAKLHLHTPNHIAEITVTYDTFIYPFRENLNKQNFSGKLFGGGVTAKITLKNGILTTHILPETANIVIEYKNLLADPNFNITKYIDKLIQDLLI